MYYSTNLSNSSRKHPYLLIPWESQFYSYYTLHFNNIGSGDTTTNFSPYNLSFLSSAQIFSSGTVMHYYLKITNTSQYCHQCVGSLVYVLQDILFKFCRYMLLFLSGQNSPPNPWVKNWSFRKQYSHIMIAQASFNWRVSCRIHMCRCHCHHYPFDYHQKWYYNWSPWEPREIILITFTMIQCL